MHRTLYKLFSRITKMNLIPTLHRASVQSINRASSLISNSTLFHTSFITTPFRNFSTTNVSYESNLFFNDFQMTEYNISHIIFDFDGVLMDTEKIFYEANFHCFAHYGLTYNRLLKQGQMGRPLNEGVAWLMQNTDLSKKGITNEVNN